MKLLVFTTPTCPPCRALKAVLQTVTLPIPVEVIDATQETQLAVHYGIQAVPTLILEDTKILKRHVGGLNEEQLKQFCEAP